ncbi:hypothetical protein FB45DRAFT_1065666 [Roridomyces roridus]|uniref:Uncharacterized protein n=1 Tax=Roridomyces roridus TaxID=1738132 RepID=A0AAD7B6Q2_9AGAR|nr:hypothetical protein FB45DRAFT_1065666 [Roridomyces roridus]
MTMLFSGRACFSPSVDASLRFAWVKHGGSLTHSKQDFARARFFFCAGPQDPWLKELLSRSLIVRHALWISNSISANMQIPVANYILDDRFDPRRIQASEEEIWLKKCISPKKPIVLNTLKRSLDTELHAHDASFTDVERPMKRARTIQPEPTLTLASPNLLDISPPSPSASFSTHNSTRVQFYRNSSPCEKQPVDELSTPSSPVKVPEKLPRIDLKTMHLKRSKSSLVPTSRISVAALLSVPRATACAFVLGEMYDGKVFGCMNGNVPE